MTREICLSLYCQLVEFAFDQDIDWITTPTRKSLQHELMILACSQKVLATIYPNGYKKLSYSLGDHHTDEQITVVAMQKASLNVDAIDNDGWMLRWTMDLSSYIKDLSSANPSDPASYLFQATLDVVTAHLQWIPVEYIVMPIIYNF